MVSLVHIAKSKWQHPPSIIRERYSTYEHGVHSARCTSVRRRAWHSTKYDDERVTAYSATIGCGAEREGGAVSALSLVCVNTHRRAEQSSSTHWLCGLCGFCGLWKCPSLQYVAAAAGSNWESVGARWSDLVLPAALLGRNSASTTLYSVYGICKYWTYPVPFGRTPWSFILVDLIRVTIVFDRRPENASLNFLHYSHYSHYSIQPSCRPDAHTQAPSLTTWPANTLTMR